MNETDDELIEKYISGEGDALNLLVKRYLSPIFNFVSRFVGKDNATDLTQDIFIKIWKNIENFNSSKSSFKTWIFVIARNTVTDFFRKRKIIIFSDLEREDYPFEDEIKDDVLLIDEELIKLEDKELLNSFLDKIPDLQKTILTLYYQEDMTFKEIGEVLKKPLNTIKSYHRRAILKLREIINSNQFNAPN